MATERDDGCAVRVAVAAGQLLVEERGRPREVDEDTADVAADRLIRELLAETHPTDVILSEELASSGDRQTAERVWIVDPLDGTREYHENGRTDWAVHLALWQSGQLVAGAVALPARDAVWSTADAVPPQPHPTIRRIAVSRSRPPAWAAEVAAAFGAELVPMGSAGAKTVATLTGEVDAYLHDGGQYEWDSAAPAVVARHYGMHVSRADGSPLEYNKPDPWSPDLVVCSPSHAARLLALIACARSGLRDAKEHVS
jgi:3'(2'), 5'-bisphosphate nucleotidase